EEIKKLKEELNNVKNVPQYHTDIHATVGQAGPQTDEAMSKYFTAQSNQINSLKNHTAFQIASALSNTAINNVAAPLFVEVSKPAFSELWQNKVYQTESQKLLAEAGSIDIELKRASKIATIENDAHSKKARALQMQNQLFDNFHKECATGRTETCQEM